MISLPRFCPCEGVEPIGSGRFINILICLGKQDNCQAAVTLSVANAQDSLPIVHRLLASTLRDLDRSGFGPSD